MKQELYGQDSPLNLIGCSPDDVKALPKDVIAALVPRVSELSLEGAPPPWVKELGRLKELNISGNQGPELDLRGSSPTLKQVHCKNSPGLRLVKVQQNVQVTFLPSTGDKEIDYGDGPVRYDAPVTNQRPDWASPSKLAQPAVSTKDIAEIAKLHNSASLLSPKSMREKSSSQNQAGSANSGDSSATGPIVPISQDTGDPGPSSRRQQSMVGSSTPQIPDRSATIASESTGEAGRTVATSVDNSKTENDPVNELEKGIGRWAMDLDRERRPSPAFNKGDELENFRKFQKIQESLQKFPGQLKESLDH